MTSNRRTRVHGERGYGVTVRLFFATDIHGSEICWNKFINSAAHYGADVLILGGDMTGKAIVPIVETAPEHWGYHVLDIVARIRWRGRTRQGVRLISNHGYYPVRHPRGADEHTPDENNLRSSFPKSAKWSSSGSSGPTPSSRVVRPVYVSPGNDDREDMDESSSRPPSTSSSARATCSISPRGTSSPPAAGPTSPPGTPPAKKTSPSSRSASWASSSR